MLIISSVLLDPKMIKLLSNNSLKMKKENYSSTEALINPIKSLISSQEVISQELLTWSMQSMMEKLPVGVSISLQAKNMELTMEILLNCQDFSLKSTLLIFQQKWQASILIILSALPLHLQLLLIQWSEEPSRWDGDSQLLKLLFWIRIRQ